MNVKNIKHTFITVATDKMKFKKHVSKGDLIKIYTKIEHIGTTSLKVNIKAFVDRFEDGEIEVTAYLLM